MMRGLLSIGLALTLFLGCSRGGSSQDSAADVAAADHGRLAALSSALLSELNATLETVHDGYSAQAARPKLDALVERMGPIQRRRQELIAEASVAADRSVLAANVLGVQRARADPEAGHVHG